MAGRLAHWPRITSELLVYADGRGCRSDADHSTWRQQVVYREPRVLFHNTKGKRACEGSSRGERSNPRPSVSISAYPRTGQFAVP
jgi:hypothetical protein